MSESDSTWADPQPESETVDTTKSAQPESVTPEQPESVDSDPPVKVGEKVTSHQGDDHGVEGVQAGGLTYVQNEDGTRTYPEQEKVDVTVTP